MSDTKNIIVYLSRQMIWIGHVGKISKEGQPDIQVNQITWDGQNLSPLFQKLKESYKGCSFHILVADEFSYILTLEVNQTEINREFIKSQVAALTPEIVEDGNFDWKIIAGNPQRNSHLIVAEVISHGLLNNLQKALKTVPIDIFALDTVSTILARSTESVKTPALILWYSYEPIGIIAQAKYNIKIQNVIIDTGSPQDLPPLPSVYKVENRSINPFLIANQMKKPEGEDKSVLSMPLKPIPEIQKHSRIFLELGILAVLLLIALVVFFVIKK